MKKTERIDSQATILYGSCIDFLNNQPEQEEDNKITLPPELSSKIRDWINSDTLIQDSNICSISNLDNDQDLMDIVKTISHCSYFEEFLEEYPQRWHDSDEAKDAFTEMLATLDRFKSAMKAYKLRKRNDTQ